MNAATLAAIKRGPPPGYVPGLGRGAAGFTTRGDVGPLGTGTASGGGADAAESGAGAGSRSAEARAARLAGERNAAGGGGGDGQFDDDDDEADRIWAAIDERMKHKRKRKRTLHGAAHPENNDNDDDDDEDDRTKKSVSAIAAQFHDLKQQLSQVTDDEWAHIPETTGDYSLRYKQNHRSQKEVFTPITDSLLQQRSQLNNDATAGNRVAAAMQSISGTTTAATSGFQSVVTNLSGLSAARGAMLEMSLDRMTKASSQAVADGGGGTNTTVDAAAFDAQGYLTSLDTATSASTIPLAQIGDLSKARLLLQSVRDTNPHHGAGWIASARVEEAAGKVLQARKLIQQACQLCGDQVEVWLEAARLHPIDQAKRILATAARTLPHQVSLFQKAASLEQSVTAQRAVLRKGLEANPTSVTLWKAAIELEESDAAARVLLKVAVEHVPHDVDLWLAWAKLETYQNAQKVLNKARKALPAERAIWIAAAKLEEAQQHVENVLPIVQRAVSSLTKHRVVVSREQWLHEAEAAESSGAPHTAAAVVQSTLSLHVDDEDRALVWADDAKSCLARGSVATARAILSHALQAFPHKRSFWMQAVELERRHGTAEALDQVLAAASERLPHVELFWLLRAKEQWMAGHLDPAREILTHAFAANPESEAVWLAAAKLEWETGESERARVLLQRARERAPSARVFMKSALLEREQQQPKAALKLIDEGLQHYPTFAKLYMMGGQICSEDLPNSKSSLDRARKYYQRGLEQCPENTALWTLASRLEERAWTFDKDSNETPHKSSKDASAALVSCFTKARGLLDLGRLKNPKNPVLWLESTRLERRAGNVKLAESFLARALQECPNSGMLLAEDIVTCPRVKKKSKSSLAVQRCPEDAHVIGAVATFFASERKVDKARKWFARAVALDKDDGDAWARYYAFEQSHGTTEQQADVLRQCQAAEPKHGELWAPTAKSLVNRGKSVGEILELVAECVKERNNQQSAVN